MNCPKCGFARPLADQVCRRCKYVFDEGRFLELAPPRAAGGAKAPRFFTRRSWDFLKGYRPGPWLPPVASLVPGLGHLIQGRPWPGLVYAVLTAIFGWMSVTNFSETSGQMMFGLAVSTHATCILDTTPLGNSPGLRSRMLAMGAILGGLMFLYWPLVVHLANRFVAPERRAADGRLWRPIQAMSADQLVIMAVLFLVTIVISAWFGRRLSSTET
jgi:hypothetical protein